MKKVNYDKFGHCVRCHKKMVVEQAVNTVHGFEMLRRLTPDYRETEYVLDDGSKMRVAICKDCLDTLKYDDETNQEVMDCVIAGWEVETDLLVADEKKKAWTMERKKKYMDKYRKLKIIGNKGKESEAVLQKKLKKQGKI